MTSIFSLIFHRHKWGPWGKPYLFGMIDMYQRKECMECGAIKERYVGHPTISETLKELRHENYTEE